MIKTIFLYSELEVGERYFVVTTTVNKNKDYQEGHYWKSYVTTERLIKVIKKDGKKIKWHNIGCNCTSECDRDTFEHSFVAIANLTEAEASCAASAWERANMREDI